MSGVGVCSDGRNGPGRNVSEIPSNLGRSHGVLIGGLVGWREIFGGATKFFSQGRPPRCTRRSLCGPDTVGARLGSSYAVVTFPYPTTLPQHLTSTTHPKQTRLLVVERPVDPLYPPVNNHRVHPSHLSDSGKVRYVVAIQLQIPPSHSVKNQFTEFTSGYRDVARSG